MASLRRPAQLLKIYRAGTVFPTSRQELNAQFFLHTTLFAGLEKLPLPGPVYIHADGCARFPEKGAMPGHLMTSPRTLNAYAHGRRLLAQEYVDGASAELTVGAAL